MHCPRCGQQQVSHETRFCSRCGFPLGLVTEILAHGGTLPQLAELQGKNKKLLTRRNGLKFGLSWFLIFTFLILPILAIAGAEEGVAVAGIVGFMGGILMMFFSLMFLENEPKASDQGSLYQPGATYLSGASTAHHNALPPQQSQPVQDFVPPSAGAWKAPNTGEFSAAPQSVTDETTKLLQKDE